MNSSSRHPPLIDHSYAEVTVRGTSLPDRHGTPEAYVYTFSMDLMQEVALQRDPTETVDACTWSRWYSVVVPRNELRSVTVKVGELALEFVQAVTNANQITTGEVRSH